MPVIVLRAGYAKKKGISAFRELRVWWKRQTIKNSTMPSVKETRAGRDGSMGLNRLDFQENMSKLHTDEAIE